jgi:AcrR family transcriptional regulator
MKTANKLTHVGKPTVGNQILKVARDIFTKYGFKKTTIDDIASELQKGKSSLYYYYKSKEELYKAVLDEEADELKLDILEEISKTDNPKEKIEIYISSRIKGIKKLGNLYDFRKSQYLSLENAIELRAKYDALEVEVIQNLLENGINKGAFEIKNTYVTAVSILIIIKGLEIPILAQNTETLNQRIDEMLPILFYGICAKK